MRDGCRFGSGCGLDPCPMDLDLTCDSFDEVALFLPLNTEHFRSFAAGTKTHEFRPEGPRWNQRTCRIGRGVVVSRGYSTPDRMNGRISSYETIPFEQAPEAYLRIYTAAKHEGKYDGKSIAKIGITLLEGPKPSII